MRTIEAAAVHCTRRHHAHADEETSALPTLVVPQRGVFRYASRTQTVVADANTALLFHPDEPYCITHPTDDGDDCTALRFDREAVTDARPHAVRSERTGTRRVRARRAGASVGR